MARTLFPLQVLWILFFGLSCASEPAVEESAPPSAPESAEVHEEHAKVRDTLKRLLTALNQGDGDAALSHFARGGIVSPPLRPDVAGREAVGQQLTTIFETHRLLLSFSTDRLSASGQLAYISGRYSLAVVPLAPEAGEDSAESGRALMVLKKEKLGDSQEEGAQWKVAQIIWHLTSDVPQ